MDNIVLLLAEVDPSCGDAAAIIKLLKHGVIPLIQWGVPIILILYGMIDFAKMVIASKEDEIKHAQKLLIKRVIYAVCVFFVVIIVRLVFNMVGRTTSGTEVNGTSSWSDCWNEY